MRGNEVGDQIESNSPPNGTEDVSRKILHPSQKTYRVINLRQVLEQEHD